MFAQPSIIRLAASGVDSKLVAPRQEDAACASVGHKTTAPNTPTRAREGVTRKQHLLNRDGSIPSATSAVLTVQFRPTCAFFVLALVGPSVPRQHRRARRPASGTSSR